MHDSDDLELQLGPTWRVQCHEQVDSTQTAMRTWLLQDGRSDWRLVTAEHQTAGRGRSGAQWLDSPGQSLLMTLAGPVALPIEAWPRLSLLAGLAALEFLSRLEGLQGVTLQLKWPNDLLVHTPQGLRKCAGILAERVEVPEQPPRWLCGLGLDVGGPLAPELAAIATSLHQVATGPLPSRSELAAGLAAAIRREVEQFAGVLPVERLGKHLAYVGQLVELDLGPLQPRRLLRLTGLAHDGQLLGTWPDHPETTVTVQPLALRPVA